MDKRFIIQKEATEAITANRFVGLIHISPRVGKTKLTIDALNTVSKEIQVLIVAPLIPIFDSWKKEQLKWKLNDNIKVTYCWSNGLKKIKQKFDLIIADEIHSYNKYVLLELKKHQLYGCRVLGLSGTLNEECESTIKSILKINKLYDYSFEEAVNDGIIADYEIICVGCQLDNVSNHIQAGNPKKPFFQTELQAYKYWDSKFSEAIENDEFYKIKNIVSKRTQLIYESLAKLNKTKELIENMDRVLVFTGRSSIADQVGEASYHSASDKKSLSKFANEEINKLSVISMISMGITIPNLKLAVFNQVKSVEALFIQQALRTMNLEDTKKATIYVVYLKNTQDEIWLHSAIAGFNPLKIKFI